MLFLQKDISASGHVRSRPIYDDDALTGLSALQVDGPGARFLSPVSNWSPGHPEPRLKGPGFRSHLAPGPPRNGLITRG